MTWIIGTSAFWGAAILISDIRVTFTRPNGHQEYHDCLQKIYPLGRNVMGGFSGSVLIGFHVLDTFRKEIAKSSGNALCNINTLANTRLPRIARGIFAKADSGLQKLGCSIILASAHPKKNLGDTPFAYIYIHVFQHPNFEPINVQRQAVVSIGSGAYVSEYMNALKLIQADRSLIQTGANSAQALVGSVGARIWRTIEKCPTTGISTYLQFGIVKRDISSVTNFEFSGPGPDGTPITVRLPQLVSGEQEFLDYCRTKNVTAHEIASSSARRGI